MHLMTGCSTLKSTGSHGWGIHGDATGHPTKNTLHPRKVTWALKMMLSKFGISSSKGPIGAPSFGFQWARYHLRISKIGWDNWRVLDLRFLWQITWKTFDINLVQVVPVLSYCLMANLELVKHRKSILTCYAPTYPVQTKKVKQH